MIHKKNYLAPLLFLSISLYCLFTLPRLLSYGMFFDGVTYASIARNLAEGYGSIWRPYYTDVIYPEFYEQPPLFFFLQSLAFRIFGDSFRVEAFWGFFMGLAILFLIAKIWLTDRQLSEVITGGWAPILMFAIVPMTSWILSNNMLEGTMTVFSTFAVLLVMQSLITFKPKKSAILAICSGFMILIAVLVKGPVGLFPLATPLIWFLVVDRKRISKFLYITLMMLLGILGPFFLLVAVEEGFLPSLYKYYSQQIIASISGSREKTITHFYIIVVVIREIVVPLAMAAIINVCVWLRTKINIRPEFGKKFWFYLLIGILGSLPIALSAKQMKWYVFPSFPFYCLSIAALFEKSFAVIEDAVTKNKRRQSVVRLSASTLLLVAILWMIIENGAVRIQKEFHNDFSIQRISIPERQIISVYPPALHKDWALVANMQRQFKVSLSDSLGHEYLLTTVEHQAFVDSLGIYEKIHPPNPSLYVLYKHRKFSTK